MSSGSEVVKVSMDQKKRRRMLSNRDSARRSRMRKQQRLGELAAEELQLRKENARIANMLQMVDQNFLVVEAENTLLRTRAAELSTRLESLDAILDCMTMNGNNSNSTADGFYGPMVNDGFFSIPWKYLLLIDQSIIADTPFLV